MNWMKERDLLIAQTRAFVQSVTGKTATAEAREVLREVRIESTAVDEIAEVGRPVETGRIENMQIESMQIETVQISRPSPVRLGEVREEIRGRVAAFRAHQELFHRERDEYCNSVLTKLRATTGHAPTAPDDRPHKP
jgi:hypothetical protein